MYGVKNWQSWTDQDKARLVALWPTTKSIYDVVILARKIGRSYHSIATKARRLGLEPKTPRWAVRGRGKIRQLEKAGRAKTIGR